MPKRGKTAARGYDSRHRAARETYVADYEARRARGETVLCALGGEPLDAPAELLDLAHNDRRDGYRGLACRPCNRGWDAARKRVTVDPKPQPRTRW